MKFIDGADGRIEPARWQVGLAGHGLGDEATVALARDRGDDYLALAW